MPRVTVVSPNYNKADFIAETLESVRGKTLTDWEHIVVDDGSCDRSVEIVQEYAAKDGRIRLIANDLAKKGGSVCRNIGLENVGSRFIMFVDSDDLLEPDCLENRLQTIEPSSLDGAVFSMGILVHRVGDAPSEVSELMEEADVDPVVEPDNPKEIAEALRDEIEAWRDGRTYSLSKNFNLKRYERRQLTKQLAEILHTVGNGN